MDEFSDNQLEKKIALVKASSEYAIYKDKLSALIPNLSEGDRAIQSYLATLICEQRCRAAKNATGLDSILQSVRAIEPTRRKLQRPVSWLSGGYAHSKAGGARVEDLSCKRQFESVDKVDSFLFEAKTQVDSLLSEPDSFGEAQLSALKEARATLEDGIAWVEGRAQVNHIAFQFGWQVAQEFDDKPIVQKEEDQQRLKKARKIIATRQAERASAGWP
ncbi:hypothetical protein CYMTET_10714 [Cymbomonas tetramitiformis]|uniref:Uncharacterized protein n=1 Tax=Cymbomonas tetramitiformis TaxID=36881 RepID=A0AAE0LDK0_9CHLO|nr:hypothetical protein CYMTET_10714 [Cymbomonas tetramitiformis]